MNRDKLITATKQTIDQVITEVISGDGIGSIITIILDEKYSFSIHCSWRLLLKDLVVITWDTKHPKLANEIKKITASSITEIKITDLYDLTLIFGNGYVLEVFCDLFSDMPATQWHENWSFSDIKENISYIITNNFTIIETKYSTNI